MVTRTGKSWHLYPIDLPVVMLAMMISVALFCHHRFVQAATATTTVEANIVSTISIVAQNGIVFGDIAASSIPGTVTVSTDGSRTSTGGASINSNTSGTPANFEVAGDPNALYMVTLPTSIVITSSAGDTITVNNFTSSPSANGQLDSSGRQRLIVGATMNVGSFQPFGAYQGTMATTVEYN
ncbi:MAG: DUF4402 domain-containing protein [Thiotrichales bacterium]|nr:MAG: DUF4402 domain-containing protein [Thiotrichales bacterium]